MGPVCLYKEPCAVTDRKKKDVRVDMELKDLNYQVRKIGVNINQIAHRLNSNIGDMRDAEYVVELMKELNARLEKLTEKNRGMNKSKPIKL